MIKKSLITFSLLIGCHLFVVAHEFWISPSKFFLAKNEAVNLTAMVGEGYEGEAWGGGERRLVAFDRFFGKNKKSLLSLVTQSDEGVAISSLKLQEEGTHMLVFSTNNSYIELEPDKFLDYLKDDGMENAIEYRSEHGEENKTSRELYRRSAKVLLQVGDKPSSINGLSSGLILDIIPSVNPYEVKSPGRMTFMVRYNGKPLADGLVRCWRKAGGPASVTMERSDKNGVVSFNIGNEGDYMISVVTIERLQDTSQADWQSTWGSLVFGIDFE